MPYKIERINKNKNKDVARLNDLERQGWKVIPQMSQPDVMDFWIIWLHRETKTRGPKEVK